MRRNSSSPAAGFVLFTQDNFVVVSIAIVATVMTKDMKSKTSDVSNGGGVRKSVKTVDNTGKISQSVQARGRTSASASASFVKSILQGGNSTDDDRWEELQRIEKQRRNILSRAEEPFWKILSHWDGTVLSHLKSDSVLWLTIALYVAVRVAARQGLPEFVAGLDAGRMSIVGGFLTFFIVFYVNQSHQRFFSLYGHSMACKGRIFDAATLVRTCLPADRALRLIRYMNAAHATAYVGLSPVYSTTNYFNHIDETFQLLTPEERARLDKINMDVGGSAHRELISWAMMEVQHAKEKGLLDRELAAMLRGEVAKLRAAAGQLYDAADLPIPFFYVHFICLLTALYLPLFAITQAIDAGSGEDAHWVIDVVVGLVVVLQAVFVIGLRIVGQKFSDPYGDDLVDLSVMFFVQFTWLNSNRILLSEAPPPSDYAIENNLARNRITIGAAWDADSDRGLGKERKETDTVSPESNVGEASSDVDSISDVQVEFGRGGEKTQ